MVLGFFSGPARGGDEGRPKAAAPAAPKPGTDKAGASAPEDRFAREFQTKCAACHTYGGGQMGDAPDLVAVRNWPRGDLLPLVKRMEKNVGPLSDEEVAGLADLLQSKDARARLDAAQKALARLLAGKTLPGDPVIGHLIFRGSRPLRNGGLACASCHTAAGEGGSLAVGLTGVFDRRGKSGLLAAIQGANFPLMQAIYHARPITTQEAVHLEAYLESIHSKATAGGELSGPPLGWIAAFVAAGLLCGLWFVARGPRPDGTRARLVRHAARSHR